MKKLLLAILFTCSMNVFAQTDLSKDITITGYTEVYYGYNFAKPSNHENSNFLYNYKRHNELAINLAMLKVAYLNEGVRGNFALMAGNYAQYNLANEPTWAQFINEANIGFKVSKKKNIWLDAGVMPSHIGFESAIGADSYNLSRSILAENSPYYETGVRLSYTSKNEKLYAAFLALNGWQKIQKPNDIQRPSFGTQLTYKPTEKLTINYSNFVGSDQPDSLNVSRLFHDAYVIYEPTKKFSIVFGFDFGIENYLPNKNAYWYSPIIVAKYNLNDKSKIACRVEHYNDAKQRIISTNTSNGFQTYGFSANYDYAIRKNILWRVEAKHYLSKDKIFDNNQHHNNNSVLTSLSLKW